MVGIKFEVYSILVIFLIQKTLFHKILAGGKFTKETYMDQVSLWVLGDPFCDGVAEHKAIYLFVGLKFGGN